MFAVFSALIPVFMLIIAGLVIRRWALPEAGQWVGIELLSYYVLFPALLIDTLARADLSNVPIGGVGGALAASVVLMSGLCLALLPLLRRGGMDGPSFTSLFQGATDHIDIFDPDITVRGLLEIWRRNPQVQV